VAFRGTGAPLHARNLRALLGMLRTLEHNLGPKDKDPAWFEYPSVPRGRPGAF
jgi:hypothetical protein